MSFCCDEVKTQVLQGHASSSVKPSCAAIPSMLSGLMYCPNMMCRIQKQQQAQRLASMDAAQTEAMANGDHAASSAAALTERMGSGAGLPKRVTPLQSSAAPHSLSMPLSNGLGLVNFPSMHSWRIDARRLKTCGLQTGTSACRSMSGLQVMSAESVIQQLRCAEKNAF